MKSSLQETESINTKKLTIPLYFYGQLMLDQRIEFYKIVFIKKTYWYLIWLSSISYSFGYTVPVIKKHTVYEMNYLCTIFCFYIYMSKYQCTVTAMLILSPQVLIRHVYTSTFGGTINENFKTVTFIFK